MEGSGRLSPGAKLRQLRGGETVVTVRGRVEILLNPGAVLRLADMSRLRMEDVALTDARVSIESGSAVVTIQDMPKPDRVLIEIGGATVALKRDGTFRFDAAPSRLRVFDGRAELLGAAGKDALVIKRGQSVSLDAWEVSKFNTKESDGFERWAEARSPAPRSRVPLPPVLFRAERRDSTAP